MSFPLVSAGSAIRCFGSGSPGVNLITAYRRCMTGCYSNGGDPMRSVNPVSMYYPVGMHNGTM